MEKDWYSKPHPRSPPGAIGPVGTPAWITPLLIADTLDAWQPHFPKALTTEDAVEILLQVGQLFDALEAPECRRDGKQKGTAQGV